MESVKRFLGKTWLVKVFFAIRLIILLYILSLLVYLYLFPLFFIDLENIVGSDYLSYYSGSLLVRQGRGSDVYNLSTQLSTQLDLIRPYSRVRAHPFKATPLVGVILIPFTFFSFATSYKVFSLFSVVVFCVNVWFLFRIFPSVASFRYGLLFIFGYLPVVWGILVGQVSIFLLIVVTLLFYLMKSKKTFLSGLICGMLLLKLQYIVLVPFFFVLSRRRLSFVYGFLLTLGFFILCSISILGVGGAIDFPRFLIETENMKYGSPIYNMFSMASFFMVLPVISRFGLVIALVVNSLLYVLMFFLFLARYRQISTSQAFVVVLLFSVFAVHVVVHDLIILLVAILILVDILSKRKLGKFNTLHILVFTLYFLPFLVFVNAAPLGAVMALLIGVFLLFYDLDSVALSYKRGVVGK